MIIAKWIITVCFILGIFNSMFKYGTTETITYDNNSMTTNIIVTIINATLFYFAGIFDIILK